MARLMQIANIILYVQQIWLCLPHTFGAYIICACHQDCQIKRWHVVHHVRKALVTFAQDIPTLTFFKLCDHLSRMMTIESTDNHLAVHAPRNQICTQEVGVRTEALAMIVEASCKAVTVT
jgi:hypothetical protein